MLTLFLTWTILILHRQTHLRLLVQIIYGIYNIVHLPLSFTLIAGGRFCSLAALFEIRGVLKKVCAAGVVVVVFDIAIEREICCLNRFFVETLFHHTAASEHVHAIRSTIFEHIFAWLLIRRNSVTENVIWYRLFLRHQYLISNFLWQHQELIILNLWSLVYGIISQEFSKFIYLRLSFRYFFKVVISLLVKLCICHLFLILIKSIVFYGDVDDVIHLLF